MTTTIVTNETLLAEINEIKKSQIAEIKKSQTRDWIPMLGVWLAIGALGLAMAAHMDAIGDRIGGRVDRSEARIHSLGSDLSEQVKGSDARTAAAETRMGDRVKRSEDRVKLTVAKPSE